MEDEEMQKEFFEEFEQGKRRLRMHGGRLTRPTYVAVSLERIIFVTIGIVMALVIVHALGVERGKVLARSEVKKIPPKTQQTQLTAQVYTISVGVFKQRPAAEAAASQLKRDGHNPFLLTQGENGLQLCVGRFSSPDEAERLIRTLKVKYRDCAIKKLKGG